MVKPDPSPTKALAVTVPAKSPAYEATDDQRREGEPLYLVLSELGCKLLPNCDRVP